MDASRVAPPISLEQRHADTLPPAYLAVVSLLLAFAALFFSIRALAWVSFFALVSATLTRKRSEFDRVQTFLSGSVTLCVLAFLYSDPLVGLQSGDIPRAT
jgi:apolipoprotein N-acyltransferase